MREIKFRAWDEREKKMFVGFDLSSIICSYRLDILINCADGSQIDRPLKSYIIMQYTGLKDKNGKEIYEGDIVKVIFSKRVSEDSTTITEAVAEIKWGNYSDDEYVSGVECWMYYPHDGSETSAWPLSDLGGLFSVGEHTIEVIGNIMENPELLTHEEDIT